MPTLNFNGVDVDDLIFNGVSVDEAYLNGTKIYQRGITLDLSQQTEEINVQSYIAANNPDNHTNITITNSLAQPKLVTGDLTGLDVTLIIEEGGSFTGLAGSKDGITLTSQMKILNSGVINGAGGDGGTGGEGLDDTYETTEIEEEAPAWVSKGSVDRVCWSANHFSWKGSMITVNRASNLSRLPIGYGPMTIGGVPNIYKGRYHSTGSESVSGDSCDGTTVYFHYTERRWTVNNPRYGGAGGAGGVGASFGVAATVGSVGLPSNPTGGNSGGTGGNGGAYGVAGTDGTDGVNNPGSGLTGGAAGRAIVGSEFLVAGSDTGTVNGDIVTTAGA